MAGHRSSAWSLAGVALGLVVYASLHPFTGWAWTPQLDAQTLGLLQLPSPRGTYPYDIAYNLLGYLPLGALLAVGMRRDGQSRGRALALALAAGGLLSYAMEALQQLLPQRVPSLLDWQLNCAGAALGALLALAVDALGGLAGWQRWRERWLLPGRGFGLALLLLWPLGLLYPPPLPFGLGQVLGRLREVAASLLSGTAWDGWLAAAPLPADALPLAPGVEMIGIVCGLLAPCLLAYTLTQAGRPRLVLLGSALLFGATVATLSTALNFGPDHALTWITPPVLPAFVLALAVALPLAWRPGRQAAVLALPVLSLGLALVHAAPADSYYAASLQAWEQGRFIRFHGLSQWIGWAWPWAALAYLLGRAVARRDLGET